MDGECGFEEIERLRADVDAIDDASSRDGEDPGAGHQPLLAQTQAVSTYPTVAKSFYSVQQVVLTGAESEGGGGTLSTQGDHFWALNTGSAIPPVGTQVLLSWVPFRWIFQHDG